MFCRKNIILSALVVMSILVVGWADASAKERQKVKPKMDPNTLSIVTSDKKIHKFKIEIADEEKERRKGLMNRETLKPDRGMLFVFDEVSFQVFWMKDTLIPLDILFINELGKITHIVENAKPNDLTPLSSEGPVRAALEISGGQSAKLGVKKGDLVKYKLFTK